MKYHKHEIRKIHEDLGESDPKDNCVYEIYKDGEYIEVCLTLNNAKEFIDTDYDRNVLC